MNTKLLLSPLSNLNRVGPALSKALAKLISQNKVFDLLLHKPVAMEKILFCPRLFEVKNDELIIIKLKVESHVKPANPRQPFKVICYNPTGYVNLVFFRIFPGQIAKMPIGSEIAVLGHLQKSSGENQIIHPQEILPAALIDKLPKVNVIYPLSAAITQKFLTQKIKEILLKIDEKNDEWIDQNLLKQQGWPSFPEALKNLHNPQSADDLLLPTPSRKRLSYDELLAWQIATLTAKKSIKENKNFVKSDDDLTKKFLSSLPFKPTNAQLEAMKKIEEEICSHKKMLRLLQGDVGSGKTIVAIFACLLNASQKKQSCVIVPTTILAKQHFSYFTKFLQQLDLQIEILTSATTKKQKIKIRENLSSGQIDILISTHACLEDEVKFKNLGLTIIDEQHRFGVMQRLKLVEKGRDVDVLLMSATPIPRSLMMGLYGDMDISTLREKPKNRQKIETLIMSSAKTDELHEAIKRALFRGEKIYWICPAIEETDLESEKKEFFQSQFYPPQNLTSAKKKFSEIIKIFDEKNVALLHGKMKESEKEKVMAEFSKADGSLKMLVATTVIEVGIDVPDATIIIIENAEHFGLAQLHQLRGRVGRSEKKSFCILLYGEKYGMNARKRLNILRESDDGFFIAEEDLKMRGSGELLGTKQSGFPEFKIADLNFDSDLLKIAHKQAELILNHDQKLEKPQSLKYQDLLRLFSYDDCLKMISGG
jgi:ATP-dependent DNA helicase RecG